MNCILKWITRSLIIALPCLCSFPLSAQAQPRWKVAPDGGITWEVRPGDAHHDHIEMSGRRGSVIVDYGVRENGSPWLTRPVPLPPFPALPDGKTGTLSYVFHDQPDP